MTRREVALLLGLTAGAALIAGFTALRGIDYFDEGVVLQAARRVADGEVPYRDFLWSYGPAQPYMLGASFELFGTSLLGWRLARVLVVALTALVVFVLTRRLVGTWPALAGWLVAACALAQPANASPFPVALLLGLSAVAVAVRPAFNTRGALLAGLLVGLAAWWRLDFGVYAGAAAGVALLVGGPRHLRLRRCAVFALAALLTTVLAYLPFALATSPDDLYESLIGKSLRDASHWTLPFPLEYRGGIRAWPPADFAEDLKDALGFYLPLVTLLGLGVGAIAVLARWRTERRAPTGWLAVLTFSAGTASYLLSRSDEFHATPLVVMLAALLPAAAAWFWTRGRGGRALSVAGIGVLGLLLLYGVSNRVSALFLAPRLSSIELPAADGVRVPPREARALERVARITQARVPAGTPIFVAPRRSDRVAFEAPLLYVVTERPNATSRDVGLLARRTEQLAVIRALERKRPGLVIRWTNPLSSRKEPNRRGRGGGSKLLDQYLAERYSRFAILHNYELLERR